MTTITLQKLTLKNFKGVQFFELTPGNITEVAGKNRLGKTTIFDAWCYLTSGKNSQDVKDFSIKTVGTSRMDHTVEGVVNGVTYTKTYSEKWVRRRGETTETFDGHETSHYINGVPVSSGDYSKAWDQIISDDKMKLLSNPFYFNTLPWQKKRELLFSMAGELSDKDIAKGNPLFEAILQKDSNLDKLKKEIGAKKNLLKKEIVEIPTRISETKLAVTEAVDEDTVNAEIAKLDAGIASLDKELADENKLNQDVLNKQFEFNKQVMKLKMDLLQVSNTIKTEATKGSQEYQNKLNDFTNKIRQAQNELNAINLPSLKLEQTQLQESIDKLYAQYATEDAKEVKFDDLTTNCPVCKQSLPEGNIEGQKEKMVADFNASKISTLKNIADKGVLLKSKKEAVDKSIITSAEQIEKLNAEIETLTSQSSFLKKPEEKPVDVTTHPDYVAIQEKINAIQLESDSLKPTPKNPNIALDKRTYIETRDKLVGSLKVNEENKKRQTRIKELESQESLLAQQIADLELDENTIADFTKTKVDIIESHINSMFQMVKFRMYNTQVNGALEEACVTLVNDVPFADVNHADQINCGIDVINSFSRFLGITVPCYVDNSEAINSVLPSLGQMILLRVTTDEKLTVTILN